MAVALEVLLVNIDLMIEVMSASKNLVVLIDDN